MNVTYPHANLVQRYSRQMLVPQMDGMAGQLALERSKVLVVGAGGIGSSLILYLAGAGVGSLAIVDFDVVEESNLHRQIIHDTAAANSQLFKASSACNRVKSLNPNILCKEVIEKLSGDNAIDIMSRDKYDVVVDATDNFDARYIINDTCNKLMIPLVSGSAGLYSDINMPFDDHNVFSARPVGMEGQVTVFYPKSGSACYRCLHPNPSPAESCRSCDNAGVVGPVPGVIGTLQSIEVIKLLKTLNIDSESDSRKFCNLIGRQLYFDALSSSFHEFKLPTRNHACTSCKHMYDTEATMEPQLTTETVQSPELAQNISQPQLDTNFRITARDYFEEFLEKRKPHILLDVRSSLQFKMVSLNPWFSNSDSSSQSLKSLRLCNIPFANLKELIASQQSNRDIFNTLGQKLSSSGSYKDTEAAPLFVICRRGIDSTKAVQLLLTTKAFGKGKLYNIEGGLNAWHREVDSSFPKY